IMTNHLGGLADVVSTNSTTGPLNPAVANAGGTTIAQPTDYSTTVNISDPNFTTLSDFEVSIFASNTPDSNLEIDLIPPTTSGLPTVELTPFTTNTAGTSSNPPQGMTGSGLGNTTSGRNIGLVFDDNASRTIQNSASPTGYYAPVQSLMNAYRN